MDSNSLQSIEKWWYEFWHSRAQREQIILVILAIFLIFVIAYKTIWLSVKEENQRAKLQLQHQIKQWHWLQKELLKFDNIANKDHPIQNQKDHLSFSQIINEQAKKK